THEIPDLTPAATPDTLIGGVFIVLRLHLIQGDGRRFESVARRINFECAGEFAHGEVFKPQMLIKVSQFRVTDVRIELIGQLHLQKRSLSLVPFKLTIKKLKARRVGFRKLRVELLSAIDLLLCALYPLRMCWLLKHRQSGVAVSELGVRQSEVRVGV